MNQVFLQKLVYQEELNVKIQLVKEHIDIARNEFQQIQENLENIKSLSLLTEQEESDDRTSWEGEPLAAAQEFLKALPNSKERTMGRNKVSYEVEVEIPPAGEKKTGFKNMFRFYSDGAVYDFNLMGQLGYKFDANKITILAKDPSALVSLSDNKPLATIDSTGKFTNLAYGQKKKSKPKKIPWLDTLQTILDWAGLIPVIGDAIDVINAVIYFWRGLYFEGFLSLIAIIPVIGSVIKLGVKGAFKGVKASLYANKLVQRWFLKGEKKAMAELMTDLMKTKKLTKQQAMKIASAFSGFGSKLKAASNGAKKVTGNNVVTKSLDKAGDALVTGQKGIDDAVKAAKEAEAATKAAKETAKQSAKIWQTPGKVINFMTANFLPRLKKLPFYPSKKIADMAMATQRRFLTTASKRPDRLGILTKFAGKESREAMAKGIGDSIQNMSKYNQSEILFQFTRKNSPLRKYYKPGQGTKGIGAIDFNSLFKSAENTEDFFKLINKNPKLAAEVGPELSKQISTRAIADGNPMWHMYRDDVGNKLISSQTAKTIQTQFAKNVDIIWNELQAAGETLGIESREHLAQFGIVPLTKAVLASATPGGYKKMQQVKNAFAEMIGMGSKVAKTGLETMGIQIDNLEEYPPLGAEEYTYGQEETED